MQAVSKDWVNNRQHAIEVLESVLELAFAKYSRTPQEYASNYEFGEMLNVLAGGLPFEVVKPALLLFVKNLLATDTDKYRFEAHAFTRDGQDIEANNAIDAAIVRFGLLINRDPEVVQELESARPEVQTALELSKAGRVSGGRFGAAAQAHNTRVPDTDGETRAAASFTHEPRFGRQQGRAGNR